MHSHHALLPVLVVPKPKRKLQLLLTSCVVAIIQPPMTQGQGKLKLHTMNLVAAGSPLTDMGFIRVFCSKYGEVSVTLSLSLTVPFLPGGQVGGKNPWVFGQFRGAYGTGSGLMED